MKCTVWTGTERVNPFPATVETESMTFPGALCAQSVRQRPQKLKYNHCLHGMLILVLNFTFTLY